jgi:hypothetical protein
MTRRLTLALVIIGLLLLAGAAWTIEGSRRAAAVLRGRGRRAAGYVPASAAGGS